MLSYVRLSLWILWTCPVQHAKSSVCVGVCVCAEGSVFGLDIVFSTNAATQ